MTEYDKGVQFVLDIVKNLYPYEFYSHLVKKVGEAQMQEPTP